jgi:hypothetical protein
MNFDIARKRKKDETDRKNGMISLAQKRREGSFTSGFDASKKINPAPYIDKFVRPQLRGDVTGILAPSGVGKTTWCMNDFVWKAKQSKGRGSIAFFALEQDSSEINEKLEVMTDDCPEVAEQIYVFSNFDDDMIGKPSMSILDIKRKVQLLKDATGDIIISVFIDHLHLIQNPTSDFNHIMIEIKKMAKELDTHVYIVSQTQKVNQIIDLPVPRTGSYNCSQFEWNVSNIISIFQPLSRVQEESGLNFLGYQFCKIRYKNNKDEIKENMNYLLQFDHDTQTLRELTPNEKTEFSHWYEKVLELRQNEEKYKSFQFDLSTTIKGKDGRTVKLTKIVGGDAGSDED